MKITGDGDIAKVLKKSKIKKDLLFFARGVSNSSNNVPESEYQREKDMLLSQNNEMRLVYFSSLSIFYANGRYQQHKLEMEKLVKDCFTYYCIVRLGNILWGKNPNTIVNFLKNKIKNNEPYKVQNVCRYLVDKKEFLHWMNMIPENFNCEMNIPGRTMKVREIVEEIKKGLL